MSTRRGWVHPAVYREARRQGYQPALAAYLGRPPVVTLDSDPDVIGWDGGTFDYRGERFVYRIEWDEDCLCPESDAMDGEDLSNYEHRFMTVALGLRAASLGSVCGDTRTWLARLGDERYLAESARDLADEILAGRARESARMWAEAGQ